MSVYAWGANDQGQLGIGGKEDHLDPVTIERFPADIVAIASGDNHSLAVTSLGDVYAWGRGREGQLGVGERRKLSPIPEKVAALESVRISQVACGSRHSLALSKEGALWQWGMLHRYESSQEYFSDSVQLPGMHASDQSDDWELKRKRLVERSHQSYYAAGVTTHADGENTEVTNFGKFAAYLQLAPSTVTLPPIRAVAAGYSFTIAVTQDYKVYAWGFNEKRQLGLGHRFNQDSPQLVRSLLGISVLKAACGQHHVLALDENGIVWSWGMGTSGQLGHGECHDEGFPRAITSFTEKVIDIACGSHHSLAVTESGKVYSWGSSEYGQQGGRAKYADWGAGVQYQAGKKNYYYAEPRLVDDDFRGRRIARVACGHLHNLALSDSGECFTWGWGTTGALGHGHRNFLHAPRVIARLRGEVISTVSAGGRASIALTSGGTTTYAFDFKPLVNKTLYHDIEFVVQGKPVVAHSAIINARCLRLRQLVIVWTRNNSGPVKISADYWPFLAFIRYLYTDHLTAPSHHIPKLRALADEFRVHRLVALCDRALALDDASTVYGDVSGDAVPIPPSTFSIEMMAAFDTPGDVRFQTEDGVISAHRCLLAQRSEYFRTAFEGVFSEQSASVIPLRDVSSSTLRDLLTYVYTDSISFIFESTTDVAAVLLAAGRFLLSTLVQRIEQQLEDQLDRDSAVSLLVLADIAQTPKLRHACVRLLASERLSIDERNAISAASISTMRAIDYEHNKLTIASC